MSKSSVLGFPTPPGWGNRSALGGTYQALQDLRGNNDGLWGNEDKMAGKVGGLFARQPLLLRAKAGATVGLRTKDEIADLEAFRVEAEAAWGAPTVAPELKPRLRHPDLYAAQKAITLSRLERTPSEVTEHVVKAAGKVDDKSIPKRDVFTQLWAAKGVPSGEVVVLSPGFQETWRDFVEVIDKLNEAGHDVLVMDHQWASEVDGRDGGLDRGFGVARDVAAVAAKAAEIARDRHGETGSVILAGNSMGGGAGVFGAAMMNALGKIELEGPQMPKGLRTVLFDPFLGVTPGFMNDAIGLASRIPLVNEVAVPSAGMPDLTDDPTAEQKGAQNAVLADARARLSTMNKALPDLIMTQALARRHPSLLGETIILHAKKDPLADPEKAKSLARTIGAEYRELDNANHVHQLSPEDQVHLVDAINDMAAAENGTVIEPHLDVELRGPLPIEMNEDMRTGTAHYEIFFDDLPTAPLGPRAFGEALQNAKLHEPFAADGEGAVRFEVKMEEGEPKLILEAAVRAAAFTKLPAFFSLRLESGQNIQLFPHAKEVHFDVTARAQRERRESLANMQQLLDGQLGRLGRLKHLLQHPEEIRTGSLHDGRPAIDVAREKLAEASEELRAATDRRDAIAGKLEERWAGLGRQGRTVVLRAAEPRPEDDVWRTLEAELAGAHETWLKLGERKASLEETVEALSGLPGDAVGQYRRELAQVLRAHGAAERALDQAIERCQARLAEVGADDRRLEILNLVYPPEGMDGYAYEQAGNDIHVATANVDVYQRQIDALSERAADRHAGLPKAIAELEEDIRQLRGRMEELQGVIDREAPEVLRRPVVEG